MDEPTPPESSALVVQENPHGDLPMIYERELAAYVAENGADLPTYYLGKLAQWDAVEAAIKAQADKMIGQLNAQRRALGFCLGQKFRMAVEADMKAQKGKKKSVDYLTGRAGFRATKDKVHIIDAEKLTEWCIDHCPAAVKVTITAKTPIGDYIKATGDVPPGAHWTIGEDRFYPAFNQDAITQGGFEDGE